MLCKGGRERVLESTPTIKHLLHSSTGTHLLATSSKTVPEGHWQPRTQISGQILGEGSAHVGGQAVPHFINTCPSITQFVGGQFVGGSVGGLVGGGTGMQVDSGHQINYA